MSGGGRRAMRAELEASWYVYDAYRPIRRADFELAGECTAPAPAVPPPPSAPPATVAGAAMHGGTNAMDLPEADARAVLGDAVYETLRDLTGGRS